MDEDKEEWGNVRTVMLNHWSQPDYRKRQLYMCVCECMLFFSLALWSCGGRGSCGSAAQAWSPFSTHRHRRRRQTQTKWRRVGGELSFFFRFSFVAFIFLYSSVSLIQHSPTSLSFTLFHQRSLFHIRWFHSEHPLTVNLHFLTPQIHHHSGCVWAYKCVQYTVSKAVMILWTTWWHCGIWSQTISNNSFFIFIFLFIVLMK